MAESEEMAASRLEAALERIARRATEHPAGLIAPDGTSTPDPRVADIATRLDALIAGLRAVLGHQG